MKFEWGRLMFGFLWCATVILCVLVTFWRACVTLSCHLITKLSTAIFLGCRSEYTNGKGKLGWHWWARLWGMMPVPDWAALPCANFACDRHLDNGIGFAWRTFVSVAQLSFFIVVLERPFVDNLQWRSANWYFWEWEGLNESVTKLVSHDQACYYYVRNHAEGLHDQPELHLK